LAQEAILAQEAKHGSSQSKPQTMARQRLLPQTQHASEHHNSVASPPARNSCGIFAALPEEVLLGTLSPAVAAVDLVSLCGASRSLNRLHAAFAAVLACEHHGVGSGTLVGIRGSDMTESDAVSQGGLISLRDISEELDGMPECAQFDFTLPSMAALLQADSGSEFMMVNVGGGHTQTVAACPPQCGDSWAIQVPLRRGSYVLDVVGWRNPHHGILDLSWDGQRISPEGGFDWYSEEVTELHRFGPIRFEVHRTATYTLRGETKRCHGRALGARHWICLKSLWIMPMSQYNKVSVQAEKAIDLETDDFSASIDPVLASVSSLAGMGALASSLGNPTLAARVWVPLGMAANEMVWTQNMRDAVRANAAVFRSSQRIRNAGRPARTLSWWCGAQQQARQVPTTRSSWLRRVILHAGAATAAVLLAARKFPQWFT